ncbi:MAG: hypothetical protein LC746_02515 [Acidobacteria bacterium]|nr:hypothetical protein [Acidobacteriota bacterium]
MKALLSLPLLALLLQSGQTPAPTIQDGAPVAVVAFEVSKDRQTPPPVEPDDKTPTREVIAINKNFQRNVRVNDPVGARDPNEDTIDGRSAAIEKNVQAARTPTKKPVDGFSYRVRLRNDAGAATEVVFWEYDSSDPSDAAAVASRRQFLCPVQLKQGKEKELQVFSSLSPTDVLDATNSPGKPAASLQEKVVVNRVEYSDGTIWQRAGWNFGEIRESYKRAVATPWTPGEQCRRL